MIGIVDYGCGNIASVANMLNHLGYNVTTIDSKASLDRAKFVILPGVGHFSHGVRQLSRLSFKDMLDYKIRHEGVPTLGICMGMQLLTSYSEEGDCEGLGLFKLKTLKFPPLGPLPHLGWSVVHPNKDLVEIPKARFYFVHSYFVEYSKQYATYSCEYQGIKFSAALHRDNVMGCQFHPEKSHKFGMQYFKTIIGRKYE